MPRRASQRTYASRSVCSVSVSADHAACGLTPLAPPQRTRYTLSMASASRPGGRCRTPIPLQSLVRLLSILLSIEPDISRHPQSQLRADHAVRQRFTDFLSDFRMPWGRLESVCTGNRVASSNLAPSASQAARYVQTRRLAHSWPSASMSARSFVRPLARLFRNQRPTSEKRRAKASEVHLHSLAPGVREAQATDSGQHIDAIWWHSKLRDDFGFDEIALRDAERLERGPERNQRGPYATRIVRGRLDPYIQIDRCARHAMHRERVGTDDEKSCACR